MPSPRSPWHYRVVAFDLDGTLLRGRNFDYSWSLVWDSRKLPRRLHRQYMKNYLTGVWDYRQWCEKVVEEFRGTGLTRGEFPSIVRGLKLTRNFNSTIQRLKAEGFVLAVVSGGIDTILYEMVPEADRYFDFVFINKLTFDAQGVVQGVVATEYDFGGKAEALKLICRSIGCDDREAVFVGEGFNDEHVVKQAGLSIAYPPKAEPTKTLADVSIREDDLSQILEHVLVTGPAPAGRASAGASVAPSGVTVTWLHLSDLHTCKPRTGWDSHRVLKPLLEDFRHIQSSDGLRPDFIFFTGDLAFGQVGNAPGETLAEQFDDAHRFLEAVRTAFDPPIARENVFLVPGNHDVDRSQGSAVLQQWLGGLRDVDPVTDLIRNKRAEWSLFMNRLKAFGAFIARHGYTHLNADPDRLIYAQVRDVKGLKVGIAGLNSAWTCGADGEKGRLWLGGDWQLGELTSQMQDADFSIALLHHPGNWFTEFEDPHVWKLIERDFRFCLHGHEHQGWVTHLSSGHTRIASAACYDRSGRDNGYNLVRLDVGRATGEVRLRTFDSSGGGWVKRVIANQAPDGNWPLANLSWLKELGRGV